MKNSAADSQLSDEILAHIDSRKTLSLSTLESEGEPYASYAPFARIDDHLYVLLSDIAVHGKNLAKHPCASILIIEDEDTAAQLFARKRINYRVHAEGIDRDWPAWQTAIDALTERHGKQINNLSQLEDFKLFRLIPQGGRYVKGFGKAYRIEGNKLAGDTISHLTGGHTKRKPTPKVA